MFLAVLVWLYSERTIPALTQDMLLLFKPLMLVYLELLFIIAAATFFSTFASPMMSVVFTLGLWLIGHFVDSLRTLGHMSQNPAFTRLTDVAYLLLPDLGSLTKVRAILMYGQQAPRELVSYIICYVLGYIVLLLLLASLVTEQREFP
jgi:hypothetical protein